VAEVRVNLSAGWAKKVVPASTRPPEARLRRFEYPIAVLAKSDLIDKLGVVFFL
jgi:hypothetical protein